MKSKQTTLVLLVMITLAVLWTTGRLQRAFTAVFL